MEQIRAAIITFSKNGALLGKNISEFLEKSYKADVCAVTTNERATEILPKTDGKLTKWVEEKFVSCDFLVFVGACGIAVRHIAPFLKSKITDPAVLVVDDMGNNVISLLSGHIGGANDWTVSIAKHLGANPVITTASDCRNKIAVDMFAKKNNLVITNFVLAKDIESALLDGELIEIESEINIVGNIPEYLKLRADCVYEDGKYLTESCLVADETDCNKAEICLELKETDCNEAENGLELNETECRVAKAESEHNSNEKSFAISIGLHKSKNKALWLIPRCIVVGVGCRRGVDGVHIKAAIEKAFELADVDKRAILKIVSIDLKKDEIGILECAEEFGVETEFFSANELERITGNLPVGMCMENYDTNVISESSDFVKRVTGVDNVCERAAIAGSNMGKVILKKQKLDKVTVALCIMERSITFE